MIKHQKVRPTSNQTHDVSMFDRPLLSIVVPTRNRSFYAKLLIKHVLGISHHSFELVIQDNSSNMDLCNWVRMNIVDPRLKYNYTAEPLSFVENFNVAITLASGQYVCLIGDDDGINPEIMQATEWAHSEGIECLSITTIANYTWPGAGVPPTMFTKNTNGILYIGDFAGTVRLVEPEVEMKAFIQNGAIDYLNYDLPKLYHGIVHRSCLEKIKLKTGEYFGGLSPDIYISIALASVVKKLAITDYPLTLPGACGESASIVEGLLKKNSKILEDAPHFRNRGDYEWSILVPRIYSVETIWADSSIAAFRAMDREDIVLQLNLPRLSAFCIVANRGKTISILRNMIMSLKANSKSPTIGILLLLFNLTHIMRDSVKIFISRLFNRIKIIFGLNSSRSIEGVDDIIQASQVLVNHLQEGDYSFLSSVKHEVKKQ